MVGVAVSAFRGALAGNVAASEAYVRLVEQVRAALRHFDWDQSGWRHYNEEALRDHPEWWQDPGLGATVLELRRAIETEAIER